MKSFQRKEIWQVLIVVIGLAAAVMLTRVSDARRTDAQTKFGDEPLYVSATTARRLSLSFNGLASDFYWMRSLQYVGGKIVAYEDSQATPTMGLDILAELDLRLLPQLLHISTTLDPQFMAPYEYGAVVLPAFNSDEAIELLNQGIAANPSKWRLYQHLGYVYWRRNDYHKASEVYGSGARLPGAPPWMMAISARMKSEAGSRGAAREMYLHLAEGSDDQAVKEMVVKQIMLLDSLEQRDLIRRELLNYHAASGRCVQSWREVTVALRAGGLRVDSAGAPLDPSGTPYRLTQNGCDVGLDDKSEVPRG
jgi:tetratricopeptide (TPR) repeat protein